MGKAEIEVLNKMDLKELKKLIKDGDKEIADAESNFKDEVEKLQAKYKSLMETKDDKIAAIKDAGLGLKKSVLSMRKKAKKAKKKAERDAKKKKKKKKKGGGKVKKKKKKKKKK